MGVNGDVKGTGSSNRRAKQKASRRGRAAAAGTVSWEGQDYAPVIAAIIVAAEGAGALRLGVTRDGGAYAVGVYAGDDYATEYIRPSEDWHTSWYEIVEGWFPELLHRYGELIQQMAQAAR
jgi:hypothetical protein